MKPDEILSIYKYDVIAKFKEPAILPVYKGATLRGAFGITFKNNVCINKKIENCNKCFISNKCVFRQIFNVEIVDEGKSQSFPQPFILEPPYDSQTYYEKGNLLNFGCIIVEKMVDYFPYFVLTFKSMEEKGIDIRGKKAQFELIKIKNKTRIVYDGKTQIISDYKWPLSISSPKTNGKFLALNFISPTRIKTDGSLIKGLSFALLIKILIR